MGGRGDGGVEVVQGSRACRDWDPSNVIDEDQGLRMCRGGAEGFT